MCQRRHPPPKVGGRFDGKRDKIIQSEFALSDAQFGWVFSAFTFAYAIFEIPGGWLGDRFGPRKVLMRIVVWWSAFTRTDGGAYRSSKLKCSSARLVRSRL